MRSRTKKRYTAGLAVAAALALSGCTLHPGSAAVVNGSDISQSKIDNLVLAACSFQKANRLKVGGATPDTSMAFLRHVLLQDLISFQISAKAFAQLHLTVSPAAIAQATAGNTIPAGVSSSDRALLTDFFNNSAKTQLELEVIGAHIKDSSVTNADHVTSADATAATTYLTAFTQRQHVIVNPSYGSWSGEALVDTTGSLSAPGSSAAETWIRLRNTDSQKVDGLPPSQVCG